MKTPAYLEAVVVVYEIIMQPITVRMELKISDRLLRPHLSNDTLDASAKTAPNTYGGALYRIK